MTPGDQTVPGGCQDSLCWEKRLRENWGPHGVGYISYGVPYNKWLYKVRKRVFYRTVRALGANFEQLRILDIGSGTGFWLDVWKSLGAQSVTASDATQVSVERLRKLYPDMRVVQLDIGGDLDQQRFEGRFDVISAFDVLFHITDDARFLKAISNMSRLLLPGGYLIFSENFLHGKELRTDHQASRRIELFERVLLANGLKTIRRVPLFVLMNTPVDTVSPWPAALWRLLMSPVRLVPLLGFLYGAVLFPLELLLASQRRESMSTEMMICQRAFPSS